MNGIYSHQLLAGPRGRRLLLELACLRNVELEALMYAHVSQGLDAAGRVKVIVELARSASTFESQPPSTRELVQALGETTRAAKYWQGADAEDQLLALDPIKNALRKLSQVVSENAPDWWSERAATPQFRLQSPHMEPLADPGLWHPSAGIRDWYTNTVAEERQLAATEVQPDYTGMWWSTPAHPSVPFTTRNLGQDGPVGLWAQEDHPAMDNAVVYSVEAHDDSKVLEIASVHDYSALVEQYPLRLTASRNSDWYRVTGQHEEWFIPHWGLIAQEYDAVHLTVATYLEGATKRIGLRNGATMIAGWSPDATYWLTNKLHRADDGSQWNHHRVDTQEIWLAA